MRNCSALRGLIGFVAIVGLGGTATWALMHDSRPEQQDQPAPAVKPATDKPSIKPAQDQPAPKAAQDKPLPAGESLYKRIGGYDALAAVTDDFIGRVAADPSLGKFLVGHSTSSKQRLRQLIVDQFCSVTGGPCLYTGRDTKTAHAGLGITEADWNQSVVLLTASLDKFKVPAKEKQELLALITTLKGDIVEKK